MTSPRSLSSALAAATVVAGAGGAHAQVSSRFIADVSARAGYAANPFLVSGDNTGSGYAELVFAPSYILSEATASTELTGSVRLTRYLERYDSTDAYSASARHERKLDEFTDADLFITFDSSVLGEREIILGVPGEPDFPDPTQPTEPGPPGQVPDVPLFGVAQRQTYLGTGGNLTHRLSPVDTVSLNAAAARTWYNANLADDYSNYDLSLAYRRTISDRSTVGVAFSTYWTDYGEGPAIAGTTDTTVYSPRLTYSRRLSSLLSFDGAFGVQFIRTADGRNNSTSFSGDINLCRTSVRSSLCVSAAQDTTSSGIGGVRKHTSADLSYSYRLAEYDSLRASVSYSKYGASRNLGSDGDYLTGEVAWERRISQRLLGGANLAYRDTYGSGLPTKADVNFQVFVRYSLGQLR